MRFRTEHQRNIAFDLLRLKREGISITQYFQKEEAVVIYGLDFLGKEMYLELKGKVNIICFIDRSHDMEYFDDIPVFSIDNTRLNTLFMQYEKVKVLVMILSDWDSIKEEIMTRFKNTVPISPYLVTSSLKTNKMINNEPVQIDKIVLVGTSYTDGCYVL